MLSSCARKPIGCATRFQAIFFLNIGNLTCVYPFAVTLKNILKYILICCHKTNLLTLIDAFFLRNETRTNTLMKQ
jgi:hypothetical protein